ncbi:pyruvate kinase [Cecembia calidifontis]|jgi:pyruvate kinase|uniref:Pyruvate kinase n=1 Tax=Cecembia calidifontis TaxID=1187080 RepID=A0A4Q7P5M8_9BACT|nr:pyruvate kinase [Cecembia calidifontis]RZS95264.1 pyruvate kinase [Cecembia calidifontis]
MDSLSDLEFIKTQIMHLESSMNETVASKQSLLNSLHEGQVVSAKNLLSYLTLRNLDIRELQDLLHIYGLSSLASSEGHILRQVQAIRERLGYVYKERDLDQCTFAFSKLKMGEKSRQLFGQKSEANMPYLMVTFDAEFADDYAKVKSLLQNGMNIARINCAHDDEDTWSRMINQVKKAMEQTGIPCKIYMDLAGPKIRTQILGKGRDKGKVKIKEGQLIWLVEDESEADKSQIVISPNESGIIHQLRKGDRIFIDDGAIRCIVEKVKKERIGLRIVRISSKKKLLKEGKGINFPDSFLQVPALTDFDKACLPFIFENADLVGYSFVKTAEDIVELRQALRELSESYPHLIIKIETLEAVENLPSLLLEGMKEQVFGLMIARGDLAVEIGFERLGEIQEEILWICEAAHVPVVWATQVLENLHKSGMATRSEITDAGHAAMAECVMINKGDYTIEVMETLRDVIHRTSTHRVKKRFTLRPLKIAQKFFAT